MKFRTRAIHVGNQKDRETGAVVPPIHVASTFVQPGAGDWGEFDYSRSGNPTRCNLEQTIASLESGSHALAFSSGMAATHAVTMLLNAGDHILAGAAFGVECRVHPAGPDTHIEQHLALRRAGWRMFDAFQSRWLADADGAAEMLSQRMLRRSL